MPAINPYLIGENLVSVTITGQNVDASYNLTDSATVKSVRALIDSLQLDLSTIDEDIRPKVSKFVNQVTTGEDSGIDISLLLTKEGIQALTDLYYSFEYWKFVWRQGDEIFTAYFKRSTFRTGVVSHGANMCTVRCVAVDVNEAGGNVTVAAAA